MAVTGSTYHSFLAQLIGSQDIYVALFTPDYVPDIGADESYDDLHATYELAEDPDPSGYQTGGRKIEDLAGIWDNPTKTVTITGDDVMWYSLTGTVRYAILYRPVDGVLVGFLDFGVDEVYANEPLTVSFLDGVITLKAV